LNKEGFLHVGNVPKVKLLHSNYHVAHRLLLKESLFELGSWGVGATRGRSTSRRGSGDNGSRSMAARNNGVSGGIATGGDSGSRCPSNGESGGGGPIGRASDGWTSVNTTIGGEDPIVAVGSSGAVRPRRGGSGTIGGRN
jgi:hypothetical protein